MGKPSLARMEINTQSVQHHSVAILCCIFSFTVMYAFMIVCSLITISVASAFGRLTREAIAAESVSTMILRWSFVHVKTAYSS